MRLVKTALSQARWMQRDRNNQIKRSIPEPRIHHRVGQPPSDRMTEMELAAVFELKNDETNHAPASISGNSGIELQFSVAAVRARELALDRAGKRFGTFRAKGRNDALGFVVA